MFFCTIVRQEYITMAERQGWKCSGCNAFNEEVSRFCGMCGKSRQLSFSDSRSSIGADGVNSIEIRFVVIGKTGAGKSATGNTILGRLHFTTAACGESITKVCKRGEAIRFNRKIMVVDTPGLFDTGMPNEQVTKEISKCIGMTSPGVHAFLLVIKAGRFTKEEQDTISLFAQHFGDDIFRHLVIVFTGKDDLDRDHMSIDAFVQDVPEALTDIINRCQSRYVAFNNLASQKDKDHDVRSLLEVVETLLQQNNGMCYTDEMYDEAEKFIRQRMAVIYDEENKKRETEIQRLRQTYEIQTQQLEQEMEKRERNERLYQERLQAMERNVTEIEEKYNKSLMPETVRNRVRDECEGEWDNVWSKVKMVATGLLSIALEIGKRVILKKFF